MIRTYTVYMRRTWDERYTISIEAANPAEALEKANHDRDNEDFDWNHVEAADREVMFIDDDKIGEQVYSLNDTEEVVDAATSQASP